MNINAAKEFWDQRYGGTAYAYGEAPNAFFREQLLSLKPGKLLLPAEGEGRNAVFAAQSGWKVSAFDLSAAGKSKAEKLALKNGVSIDYTIGEFSEVCYPDAYFDAIALIFAHFSAAEKREYLHQLDHYLKPGGTIIFEAYSKDHLKFSAKNPEAGGPKDPGILYSKDEIREIFPEYEMILLEETEIEIHEGLYHNGMSSVIRFLGKKK